MWSKTKSAVDAKGLGVKGPARLDHALHGIRVDRMTLDQAIGAKADCQQGVDAKAFKGRGQWARFLDAKQLVDRVHAEMEALVGTTLAVPGRLMYLCAHRRSLTGQVALRWRRAGAQALHLAWQDVEATIAGFGPEHRAWYVKANQMVHELNQREIDARRAMTRAKRSLDSGQSDLPLRGGRK